MRQVGALLDAKACTVAGPRAPTCSSLTQSNGLPARRVDEVLELTGMTSVAGKRIKGFSLGMSQRLGIAAAMLGDPQILMFDEPVNGLDPEGILWIRKFMQDLAARGRTVFVSSHLMSEMALTAEHLIVIGRGSCSPTPASPTSSSRTRPSGVRIRTPQPEQLLDALATAGRAGPARRRTICRWRAA